MEEIVSLIVANGIFAVLFCGLLVYELRDSRTREGRYTQTIKTLGDRLATIDDVKSDTESIKSDVDEVKLTTERLKSDVDVIKQVTLRRGKKEAVNA